MERRYFIRNSAIITGASLLLQQKTFAKMILPLDYKIKMLSPHIGIFTERGGTIGFLLTEEGIVVVDAQFPDTAIHLIEELKKRNTNSIRYLLNTHHHLDHTSGNINFKGLAEHVAAHENSLANQKTVAEKNSSVDKQLYPDVIFKETWQLKIGSEVIKASYYGPGHTNGDVVYHFQNANISHLGDLAYNKRHPNVDRASGANMKHWITIIDQILNDSDNNTQFIFGHSFIAGEETASTNELKKFQDYLGRVLEFADQEIKKGVSKEDFLKNKIIPGASEWGGVQINRSLTGAYEEIIEAKKI
ncbi:MAG: MBL fold metallo-hydrolase [Flavisolibacter sp.]